jgi:hypothetical protein
MIKEPTFEEKMEGYNGILSGVGHLDTPLVVNLYKPNSQELERRIRAQFGTSKNNKA